MSFHAILLADYASFAEAGKGLASYANIAEDGRIFVTLDLKEALPDLPKDYANPVREFAIDPALEKYFKLPKEQSIARQDGRIPKLNVVIMIVGSRGTILESVCSMFLIARPQATYNHILRLGRSW